MTTPSEPDDLVRKVRWQWIQVFNVGPFIIAVIDS